DRVIDCATMRSDVIGDFQEPNGAVLVEGGDMAAALVSRNGSYGILTRRRWAHSGLMLAARITLPHFSASLLMNLPKSAGEPASAAAWSASAPAGQRVSPPGGCDRRSRLRAGIGR